MMMRICNMFKHVDADDNFWVMMIIFWVMMMIFLVIMMYFFALQHVTTVFVQISRIFPMIPLKVQNFLKILKNGPIFCCVCGGAP